MNSPIKPATEIRIGSIKAAVWRNETEGSIRYATTFTRIYRDSEVWKTTDSFGRDDLLVLAKIADQAHSWICAQVREFRVDAPANGRVEVSANGIPPRSARTSP